MLRVRPTLSVAAILALAALLLPPTAGAARVRLVTVAEIASPSHVTHAGDGRLFIATLDGRIVIAGEDPEGPHPEFLDIGPLVSTDGEQGLFAVAFHPDYATNGLFFVSYTDLAGRSVVARYQVSAGDPDVADPASAAILLTVDQPESNHNGGQIAFGPHDGYLYVGLGDGGGFGDAPCHAQRDDTLLGKLLRLDVDQSVDVPPHHGIPPDNPFIGGGGLGDEVWATGLRNPWRFAFDRATGDLYIGDVGQDEREEVDRQPAASAGGEDYGWKVMEGSRCFDPDPIDPDCPAGTASCFDPSYTAPIFDYGHGDGCSITGGLVYRGTVSPALRGQYVFGDFCSGTIWALAETAPGVWTRSVIGDAGFGLTSFGEDRDGELYAAVGFERVVRLEAAVGRAQARCLNDLNKAGVSVIREQGKAALACLKHAARDTTRKLGTPSQARTAQACLTNDVGAKVARRAARLAKKDATRCRLAPEQRPDFAYTTAVQIGAVAPATPRGVMRALFGAELDLAVVRRAADRGGATCQAEVAKRAQSLLETLWKAALKAKKLALKGGRRGAPPPVTSTAELGAAISDYLAGTAARAIAKADAKLRAATHARCGTAATLVGDLFPGCGAGDLDGVATCAADAARCQFCQSLNGFDDLALDCDAFDDGQTNASCEPALCTEPGGDPNLGAALVDCPRLSDHRLFAGDDPTGAANGDGLPFDLTTPLFSDYAAKSRVLHLPPGASAAYDPDAVFDFPVGTVIAKTFTFLTDLRQPELGGEVVETRLLVHRPTGWEGLPYVWEADLSEAVLTPEGTTRDVAWVDLAGAPRATTYEIPSAAECGTCHGGPRGDEPIGPKARLLNRAFPYPGGAANQLDHWSALGALTGAPAAAAAPRLPVWDDPTDGTLDARARAYLESNCAHCHREEGAARFSGLLLTAAEPLGLSTGVCKPSQAGDTANGGHVFDIVPGDPAASVVIVRMDSIADGIRMPELAKSVVHDEGVDLIRDWITSLPGSCD